jgi:hypothetical protein
MWVQATVLLLLAGLGYVMVALYARGWNQTVAVAEGGRQGHFDEGLPPGAPTRAQVKQLHDTLRKKLGFNPRGLARVASVDYDGWPDRLVVVFALDHDPASMTAAQAAELSPMRDVLEAVHAAGLNWGWLMLCGTAPLEGPDQHVAEMMVVRAQFSRAKLDKVKWSALEPAGVPPLADSFYVEPELRVPRAKAEPSATGPATRPSTLPAAG